MKEQSTSKGFAILSVAGILVKILSILYMPFLLMIIGNQGWGIYQASYQIYVFVYVIANSGIPVAISKLVAELVAVKNYKDAVRSFKIARFILLIAGTVLSVIMLILAGPLADFTHVKAAKLAIIALAPTLFFTSIESAYRGYFQGRGNMTPTAVSQVIEQIINTVFTLVFAALLLRYGVEAACAGGTIGTSLGALVGSIYLIIVYERNKTFRVPKGYKDVETRRYSTKQLVKKILAYGFPLTLAVALQYAGNIVDLSNVIGRLIHAGFSDVNSEIKYGILAKYNILINVPITIISALSAAILPSISGAAVLGDKEKVEDRINYAFRFCFLIAIPAAVGLASLSTPIFDMMFSAKYASGATLMQFGSVVVVLMAVVQIQNTILQSIGKLYMTTIYLLIGIGLKITTNYILVGMPKINILGAVFGSIVAFSVPLILNDRLIRKTLRVRLNLFSHAVKPLMASVVMGVIAYGSHFLVGSILGVFLKGYLNNAISTITAIALGAFVYLYVLILNGGMVKEDLNTLPRKVLRFIPNRMMNKIKNARN